MRSASHRRSYLVLAGLLVLSGVLLLTAWVAATRPFGAPDEADHYLRALDIAGGQLLGSRVPWVDPGVPAAQVAWAAKDTRGVFVSPRRSPGRLCVGGVPDRQGSGCVEPTHTGDYQPLAYALPALALVPSSTANTGLWLSRAASAVQCAVFVILAGWLLWSGSLWSLLGLVAALSPMVFFVASVVNPNGLEIAADLAFTAGVLRIWRTPLRVSGQIWTATAISGAVTVLSWQLGPVFAAMDLLLLLVLLGPSGTRELYARYVRPFSLTVLVLGAALAVFLAYGVISGVMHATVSVGIAPGLRLGVRQLGLVLREWVGVFGQETIRMPAAMYGAWWLALGGLLVVAGWLGTRRDRVVLAGVTLLALAFPVVFYAWVYRFTGFGLQGRYVIPALSVITLVAGEIISRSRNSASPHLSAWAAVAGVCAVATFQLIAWWVAASHAASSAATFWFVNHATWTPPLGWWPWTVVAVTATLGTAGCATILIVRQRRSVGEQRAVALSR